MNAIDPGKLLVAMYLGTFEGDDAVAYCEICDENIVKFFLNNSRIVDTLLLMVIQLIYPTKHLSTQEEKDE